MAGATHLAIGLASKKIAPKINLAILILSAYFIDIIWGIFFFLGVENMSTSENPTPNYWSHSLFMAIIWTIFASGISWWISKNKKTTMIIGSLVFSHWIIDFIAHPMTAVFPYDQGLPLIFNNKHLVGLGLWRTTLGVNIGEYGMLAVGIIIYIISIIQQRKNRNSEKVGI